MKNKQLNHHPSRRHEILLVNIIHPKKGKMEEFAKLQVHDFATYGSQLDGSSSNEFFVSVNENEEGHCVNVAHFDSLEAYYNGTSTETFKKHIERIKPLIQSAEPLLLKRVWSSGSSEESLLAEQTVVQALQKRDSTLHSKPQNL